jgi:hypothetical protein
MSKKQGVASRLCVVLGGMGLVVGVWLPRASAAPAIPPYTNANYDNRYECIMTTADNFAPAVVRLLPNGSGGYKTGTLSAPANIFGIPFDPTKGVGANFCSYTLSTGQSFYVVNSKGIVTTEILAWSASGTNPAGCAGDFTMNDVAVVQQGSLTADNVVTRVLSTSGNLLDGADSGKGECYK